MTSSTKPSVSAVLAVYNSASTLRSCLDSLLAQTVPLEIIVVDDGSTDSSVEIVRSYSKIKVIKQNHQGPASARNLGASHAQGDILLFVDSDMTFDKHYVQDLIQPILDNKAIGTYTVKEMVANWDEPLARSWNWQEGWAPKYRFPAEPPQYGTDFRAIKKSEFERVGGFDNIGYTDTWTLFKKLGKRPLRTNAVCYHRNPSTYQAVFRQARWVAKRPYKYGIFGALYALIRTSLPVSLLSGPITALRRREITFIPFKIVYDLGRLVGIVEMLVIGSLAK